MRIWQILNCMNCNMLRFKIPPICHLRKHMELSIFIPKTADDEIQLAKALTSKGIDPSDADSLIEVLRNAGKNKRLRDAVAQYNVQAEKGKVTARMKKCAIKEHIRSIVSGVRAKYASCAGKYASQLSFAPDSKEHIVLKVAMASINGITAQIRMRRSRLFAHKNTQKLLQKYPFLTERAIELLHFTDRYSLVKEDYETIDNFLGLLDLDKAERAK